MNKPAIDMKTQRIAYIGKKEQKYDNIAGTGIMWNGFGDVHTVEHTAAVKMLKHRDVWRTEAEFLQMQESAKVRDMPMKGTGTAAPPPVAAPAPPAQEPVKDTAPVNSESSQSEKPEGDTGSDEQTANGAEPPDGDLYFVFEQLDPNNPDDFGARGPKAARVSELAGRKVTVAEIAPAWEAYKADK